jgi:hypothetical protein
MAGLKPLSQWRKFCESPADVCFWPKADIGSAISDVRFWP